MVGAWADVQILVDRTNAQTSSIVMARLLLAMRAGDPPTIAKSLSVARNVLGIPITAAGVKGYRRSYDAVLDLHLTHELEMIHNTTTSLPASSQGNLIKRREMLLDLSRTLTARLDATLPTFRIREPVLSMRRTAFALTWVHIKIISQSSAISDLIMICDLDPRRACLLVVKLVVHGLLALRLLDMLDNGKLRIAPCCRLSIATPCSRSWKVQSLSKPRASL
jgi:hypothetical protein